MLKKTYNIVSVERNIKKLMKTIYIGNHRSDNGAKGNVYLRIYDRSAVRSLRT